MNTKLLSILCAAVCLTAMPVYAEGLPSSVDNSTLKYFPPVFNQIGGSCAQASSVGYLFTYEMNRLLDRDASESAANRYSYLYTWNLINYGEDGGSFTLDAQKLAAAGGIMSEEDFPRQTYAGQFRWASGYEKYYNALHNHIAQAHHIIVADGEGLEMAKQYLYNKNKPGETGGLLVFSSNAGNWRFNDYYDGPSETGYKSLLTKLADDGGHAMTIVGYDDTVEFTNSEGALTKGAFIVVNSYGFYYHDRGRYYLPYWFFLDPGRNNQILSADLMGYDVEYTEPKMVFKVNLRYTSRDDLSFKMGISDSGKSVPTHNYTLDLFQNAGGDHQMQGAYGPDDIELGFDFSRYVKRLASIEKPAFYLTVNRSNRGKKKGEGEVTGFKVYDYRKNRENPEIISGRTFTGGPIEDGDNVFRISLFDLIRTTMSRIRWIDGGGNVIDGTLVVRTADGKYAKMKVVSYDRENGRMTIKYVYSPSGSKRFVK